MTVERKKECSLFKFRVILAPNSKQIISKAPALKNLFWVYVCVWVRACCAQNDYIFLQFYEQIVRKVFGEVDAAAFAFYVLHTRIVIPKELCFSLIFTFNEISRIFSMKIFPVTKPNEKNIKTLPNCRSLNFFSRAHSYIQISFYDIPGRSPFSVLIFFY